MHQINLKIITPNKIVLEEKINSINAPSVEGEITILPRHQHLFAQLAEGIVKIKKDTDEDYLAIGGGFLQTDGEEVNLLVSRAYGQSEINEELTQAALEQAKKLVKESQDKQQQQEAIAILKRSIIDLKLLKKRKKRL